MSSETNSYGHIAREAHQGAKNLPKRDQWQHAAAAVIAEYNARHARETAIPPDTEKQFTTMAEAIGGSLQRVGATALTDWRVESNRRGPTDFSMAFDFGRNPFFILIGLGRR